MRAALSAGRAVAARVMRSAGDDPHAPYYELLHAFSSPHELAAVVLPAVEAMLAEARHGHDRLTREAAEADQQVARLERFAAAARAVVDGHAPEEAGLVVAGHAIADTAIRLAGEAGREELHYREWFAMLRRAGYVIESEQPLDVFLTALTRHPQVEGVGSRTGVYRVRLNDAGTEEAIA